MRILLACICAVCFARPAGAFGFSTQHGRRNRPCFMSDLDQPSDTSSDSVFEIESETYTPTEGEALVTSVMDSLPGLGGDVTSETRRSINEALLKLEAMNPSASPTMSSLLNGVWELRYAANYAPEWSLASPTRQIALFLYSGGYSPGLFALSLSQKLPSQLVDVGDLEISISREQPRIEAQVSVKLLGGNENNIVVSARLDVESDVRMRETYESATVLDQAIELPEMVQYSRDLYITYLDDDLLVVRDASGVPEVLVRRK